MKSDLDIKFNKAFEKISTLEKTIAPDNLLKLYAYYKQATSGNNFLSNTTSSDLVNGFKFNAWKQLNGMPQEKAKKEYIKLAKIIIS